MKRYSPSERAMFRYYARIYGAIFARAFDEMAGAAAKDFDNMHAAMLAIGEAAAQQARNIVGDIIGQFLKEKVIGRVLAELPP